VGLRVGPPQARWRRLRLPARRQLWLVPVRGEFRWRRRPSRKALLTIRATDRGVELQALEVPGIEEDQRHSQRLVRVTGESRLTLAGVQGVVLRLRPEARPSGATTSTRRPVRVVLHELWQLRHRWVWLGAHLQTIAFAGMWLWLWQTGQNASRASQHAMAARTPPTAPQSTPARLPEPEAPAASVQDPGAEPDTVAAEERDGDRDLVGAEEAPLGLGGPSEETLGLLLPGLDWEARALTLRFIQLLKAPTGSDLLEIVAERERVDGIWVDIIGRLAAAGLHPALAGLPLIESSLCPYALSPNREGEPNALGLWQFVWSTGQRFGLDVGRRRPTRDDAVPLWAYADRGGGGDRALGLARCTAPEQAPWLDSRQDVEASTEAALKYLTHLQRLALLAAEDGALTVEDVPLFVATAYNQGERFIDSAYGVPGETRWSEAVERWTPVAAGLEDHQRVRDFAPEAIARALVLGEMLGAEASTPPQPVRAPIAP
jgi:hypothetical protein